MKPLISIIVPVYNVEAYMNQCIESIVGQTYKNIEIILVDDGSTDNCPTLCDDWKVKDDRIKVIHKENGGLSDARNVGIQIAQGEYIGFVDSDDVIEKSMYESLLEVISKYEADIVQCQTIKYSELRSLEFISSENDRIMVLDSHDAVELLIKGKGVICAVYSMLIKSNLAKSVLFEVGKINEDVLWTYRIMVNAKKVVLTSKTLYGYFQRSGSIMNSEYTEKRFDALEALQKRAQEVKKDYEDLYPEAELIYIGACMYHYQWLCRLQKTTDYESLKKKIHLRFMEADRKVAYKIMPFKHAIWNKMFEAFPDFTCYLRNVLRIGL